MLIDSFVFPIFVSMSMKTRRPYMDSTCCVSVSQPRYTSVLVLSN